MAKKLKKRTIGDFGEQYTEFYHKPKEAIKYLKKVKRGECVAALYRKDIGDIDIVWGENDKNNKGFGLKHIIEKHGKDIKRLGFEVEDFIPIVVQFGNINIKESTSNKIVFENQSFRFIIKTHWNGKKKNFLLTSFDLLKKAHYKK